MTPQSNEEQEASDVCDWSRLLSVVSGNEDIAAAIAKTFTQEMPTRQADIEKAIQDRDGTALHRGAHTLKSSLNMFGASKAVEIVLKLEDAGKQSNFSIASELVADFKDELQKIERAIHERWLDR